MPTTVVATAENPAPVSEVDAHVALAWAVFFSGDLSDWEVEDVDHATGMFWGAASFTHQLRGEWSHICMDIQELMFDDRCPGSIAPRPIRVRKRKRRTADGDGS